MHTSSPKLTILADVVEGRRRLMEATREASRWRTPKRRTTTPAAPKVVAL